MGRVFSSITIINGLAMPLGIALFGPMSDAIKIELLLIFTGLLLILGGLLLYRHKTLSQIDTQTA